MPTALASGIQVSPARLDFVFDDNAQKIQEITVANPSPDVVVFAVYSEDYPNYITAEPTSFSLEPGGRRTVTVKVNPKGLLGADKTQLAILGRPLDQTSLSVAAGAKIPITITVSETAKPFTNTPLGQLLIILLVITATTYLVRLRKKV